MLPVAIPGLKDSKKLSRAQREALVPAIQAAGAAIGLGWVTPVEIDEIGLTAAVRLAMERALDALPQVYETVIIDGNFNFLAHRPDTSALIKADDTVPAVSAASIVAKVARDNYMRELALQYPGYGFEQHVGYGTALHQAGIKQLGVSEVHRRSFKPIRALIQ